MKFFINLDTVDVIYMYMYEVQYIDSSNTYGKPICKYT